jgi:plastocyanin
VLSLHEDQDAFASPEPEESTDIAHLERSNDEAASGSPGEPISDRRGAAAITRPRSLLLGAVAAAALAAAGNGSAASAKTVHGTVGPGFTIGLTMNGKNVTKLKAGAPYRFVISDRADIHDFHLSGPGLDRVLTGVEFTGTKSAALRLKKGSYRFVCDPHASIMHGRFVVS